MSTYSEFIASPHFTPGLTNFQNFCISVSSVQSHGTLRSAAHGHLTVPRMQTATAQSRSFVYVGVGPTSWNRLSRELRISLLSLSLPQFRNSLKSIISQ